MSATPDFTSRSPAVVRISELADRLGTTPRALRYYEEIGLIAPTRTRGGTRLYDRAALARAKMVVTLRRLGLASSDVSACVGAGVREDAGHRELRSRLDALLARSLQDCRDLELAIRSLET